LLLLLSVFEVFQHYSKLRQVPEAFCKRSVYGYWIEIFPGWIPFSLLLSWPFWMGLPKGVTQKFWDLLRQALFTGQMALLKEH